jgi:hypothetical protein
MDEKNSNSISKFTLWEKFSVQFSFWAGIASAAYGLSLSNVILGVIYPLIALSAYFLLMRYTVCPRCPHLNIAGDCLQVPVRLTKIIVSPNRTGPLNLQEKIIFNFAWYGSLLIPIYWLLSTPIFLAAFLFLYGGGLLLQTKLRFCPKCENKICMKNKNQYALKT